MEFKRNELKEIMSNTENEANVPALFNREIDENVMIPSLPTTTNLRDYYTDNAEHNSSNYGYIDQCKSAGNVRILSLNPHGFRPYDEQKTIMMKQAIEKLSIDVILLQETNTKWTSRNISKLESNVRLIDRESVLFTADSNE